MVAEREYPGAPRLGVGALVMKEGAVLLVQRGAEPNRGLWALPGGVVRLGETLQEAAEREIREETGVTIEAGEPFYVFDFIERDAGSRILYHYVIVDLEARYIAGEPRGADDAADARWVSSEEIQDLPVSPATKKLLERVSFGPP